jgi:5-formyltetrahydrofolate cyclo-ligase
MPLLKPHLRSQMRALLKTEKPRLPERSEAVCNQIRTRPFWSNARTVGLFYPLPDEPDLLGLMTDKNRRYVFPRILGESLVWHEVSDVDVLLPTQALGVRQLREPREGPLVSLAEIDLLLVPGLAFTAAGARLGRGGGYYDRVLAALGPSTVTSGVCFAFQILKTLPLEEHDLPVQHLCSA